ncbi:MAG: glycosyltransferase family 4 protein [Solirubrobacterales bacterium]|nr:glycosyltransferase family 4 protein [Solirubrobacterales bacterium]
MGVEVISAGSVLGAGQGGATGYIEALIPAMLEDERISKLTVYTADWYEPAKHWRHPKLRVRTGPVPTKRPLRVAYENTVLPLQVAADRVDVLLCTANFRPLSYRGRTVVALHAVQHFVLNDDIGRLRSAYVRFAVPRSVRGADRVVAVTDTLRTDAIKLFNLDPNRISAVPMGPSPWVLELASTQTTPYRTASGAPYVLCISRLYALKNHRRMISAFAKASHGHELVIVGGDADVTAAELGQHAAELGIADKVHFLGRVDQDAVPGLFAGATAVAYVSLYETFGHPVLEAFATGTALLTSSDGATGETAGGAALLADPKDVDDIAAQLQRLLTDAELRERLIAAGHRRVQDFSWERHARGTVDALEQALAG